MTPTRFLFAPAGHGKTAHVIAAIRSLPPLSPVRVLVPDQVEAMAFRRRLAQAGGALGAEVQTFYGLYADVLALAARMAGPQHAQPNGGMARLSPAVRHRLIQHIAEGCAAAGETPYYAPVCSAPGFVRLLGDLFGELKRARVLPHALETALAGREPRLRELARLYAAYQAWLLDTGWVDADGQGWLAAVALETHPALLSDLALLAVDGFDEFNPTQLHLLRLLAGRAQQTIVTLTGDPRRPDRLAHRRFARARRAVTRMLGAPDPLAVPSDHTASPAEETLSPLAYLERYLFEPTPDPSAVGDVSSGGADEAVAFLEAQNRAAEARAALRWLKARLVRDGLAFSQVAIVARDPFSYRPFLEETAAEFGIPLRFAAGADLATNPAIDALLSLLTLPRASEDDSAQGSDAWGPRALLDALTSPYFDWSSCGLPPTEVLGPAQAGAAPTMELPEHGRGAGATIAFPDRLYDLACDGQVLGGLDQWRAAFELQAARSRQEAAGQDDEPTAAAPPPTGPELAVLAGFFEAVVARMTPPPHATLRTYVAWVEELIGADPLHERAGEADGDGATALHLVARAVSAPATMDRDLAALRAFKDVLRGLVLADEVLGAGCNAAVSYGRFVADVIEAVESAAYTVPVEGEAVLVASALEVRGLTFDAVALLGLAEGDFPRAEREDVLLRDADRLWLAHPPHGPGFALEPSLRGDEATIFYQAVTRARRRLLLCRPYLADDGQPWEASPYWFAVRRLFAGAPLRHVRPTDPLTDPASTPELVVTMAQAGSPWAARAGAARSAASGDLTALASELAERFGADQAWSCSRLETYAQCPYYFWAAYAMELTPRPEPQAGFDVLILGSIYHEVLERLYGQTPDGDPDRLRARLPDVAAPVFDTAPAEYGFRPTPLWEQQRQELTEVLRRTLEGLIAASEGYAPRAQELPFGLRGRPPLVLDDAAGTLRLRGYIDRVDVAPDGHLRIIDYKSGSTAITLRDLQEGRRLQLPLYALAAARALDAPVSSGFYWHINAAEASKLELERFTGGVDAAIATAAAHALAISAAVRNGQFAPRPPSGGCPASCPAIAFCERYVRKGW